MMAWHPVGFAVFQRRSAEMAVAAGPTRAVLRVTPRRVLIELERGADAIGALAVAHRMVAAVLEEITDAEGWLIAEASVRETPTGARVVVLGVSAADAIAPFFGGAADPVLRPAPKPFLTQAKLPL